MTLNNLQINSAAITDKGLSEKRPQNEDSYLELRDSGLYAVADGVGGAQAGDVASQMAVEILGEAFINMQEDGDAEERMKLAIQQANSAIYQMAHELAQLSTMATTIVAVHINGNIATIGHVGDSRLYRLDEKRILYRETQDHSVVEEEVRAGRMTAEQALTHPSRNVISRALGAEQTVEIDMKTIMFEPNNKFLVCSDGVTRHISDEEIRSLLLEEDNYFICQAIKELCYERGAEDNLTAVIVSVAANKADQFNSEELADFEEDTIANARTPITNIEGFDDSSNDDDYFKTQELNEFDDEFNLTNDSFDDEELDIPTISPVEDNNKISIATNENTDEAVTEPYPTQDVKSFQLDDKGGVGIIGKILSGLLWLIIGGLIGAFGYYYYANNFNNKLEDVGQVQTENTALVDFETKRRAVDVDPQIYISNNPTPKNATEHYLLGRAFRMVGELDNAKKELEEAQNKINEVDAQNRNVIENDISLELDIINVSDNVKDSNKNKNVEVKQDPVVENANTAAPKALETTEPAVGKPTEGEKLGTDN